MDDEYCILRLVLNISKILRRIFAFGYVIYSLIENKQGKQTIHSNMLLTLTHKFRI
jgi:hypothetical protein